LAICRAIVDAHGGRIGAENRVDVQGRVLGARFWFMLPADEVPAGSGEVLGEVQEQDADVARSGHVVSEITPKS
jgi:two-component system sensor histidine kinase KdpD